MKTNISKTKIIVTLVVIILIISVAIISFFSAKNLEQKNILKKELINVSTKNLLKDNYDIKIKTTGEYAYIEKNVKNYYKELSVSIKILNNYLNDEKLIEILSTKNIQNDGPKFEKSYKILEETRQNIDETSKKITNLCDKKTIKEIIKKDKIKQSNYKLYLELIYTKEKLLELDKTKNETITLSNDLNVFLDKVEEIIEILKNNNNSWFIEDDKLYFKTDKLVNQYNTLYKELNNFVQEKFSKYNNNTTTKNNI